MEPLALTPASTNRNSLSSSSMVATSLYSGHHFNQLITIILWIYNNDAILEYNEDKSTEPL